MTLKNLLQTLSNTERLIISRKEGGLYTGNIKGAYRSYRHCLDNQVISIKHHETEKRTLFIDIV